MIGNKDSIPWCKMGLRYLHMMDLALYVHSQGWWMNKSIIIAKYGYYIEGGIMGFIDTVIILFSSY